MTDRERARLRKDLDSIKTVEVRSGGTQAGKTTAHRQSVKEWADSVVAMCAVENAKQVDA